MSSEDRGSLSIGHRWDDCSACVIQDWQNICLKLAVRLLKGIVPAFSLGWFNEWLSTNWTDKMF